MVEFGGHMLPTHYGQASIADSHRWTRQNCSVFDVSHMLQTEITGRNALEYFESLTTADIAGLHTNSGCLTLFTKESNGGILDDLIVVRTGDESLFVVSNASRRQKDVSIMKERKEHFVNRLGKDVKLRFYTPEERSLVAVQGPKAAAALEKVMDVKTKDLYFMSSLETTLGGGTKCRVTRCGYTGEDGFEVAVDSSKVATLVELLLKDPDVKLAGLGPRDTLRLEAGLCLYGNDIDETTTPVAAGLMWTIGKRRRKEADFPGAKIILEEHRTRSTPRYRVGLKSLSGPPLRRGTPVFLGDQQVGTVTSGAPAPSLQATNVAMAYVDKEVKEKKPPLRAKVRNTFVEGVQLAKMPFVEAKYYTRIKK
ncbi:hypothetical protein AAG570_006038 [Ranatra chinensis]|uniref:Aminomethyltransferase n=1 Tax=Ranatra chinensis TaxID=642074 RepID=A0ABD0XX66_9HEMI